jgi:hypothetical protein
MKFKMLVAMALSCLFAASLVFAATAGAEDPMGADQDQDIMQLADNGSGTSAISGVSGTTATSGTAAASGTSATVSGTGTGSGVSGAASSSNNAGATTDNSDMSADTATGDDDY